jgi:hypothetical protein
MAEQLECRNLLTACLIPEIQSVTVAPDPVFVVGEATATVNACPMQSDSYQGVEVHGDTNANGMWDLGEPLLGVGGPSANNPNVLVAPFSVAPLDDGSNGPQTRHIVVRVVTTSGAVADATAQVTAQPLDLQGFTVNGSVVLESEEEAGNRIVLSNGETTTLTVQPVPAGYTPGTIRVTASGDEVELQDTNGNALSPSDFSDPQGILAPIAQGQAVTLQVEGKANSGHVDVTYSYQSDADPNVRNADVVRIDLVEEGITIQGYVHYTHAGKSGPVTLPFRNGRIEIQLHGNVFDTSIFTYTDDSGFYSETVDAGWNTYDVLAVLRPWPEYYVNGGSTPFYPYQVVDEALAGTPGAIQWIRMSSPMEKNFPANQSVVNESVTAIGAQADLLYIFDAVMTTYDFYESTRTAVIDGLELTYEFDTGNFDWKFVYPSDVTRLQHWFGPTGVVYLNGTPGVNQADWDIVAHEFGHIVQHVNDFAVGPRGAHGNSNERENHDDRSNVSDFADAVSLAWNEGVANFFSVVSQLEFNRNPAESQLKKVGDAKYDDFDLEKPSAGEAVGEDSEWSVAQILWDFYDDANESNVMAGYGRAGGGQYQNDPISSRYEDL